MKVRRAHYRAEYHTSRWTVPIVEVAPLVALLIVPLACGALLVTNCWIQFLIGGY